MTNSLFRFSGSRIVVDTTHSVDTCCLDDIAKSYYSMLGTRGVCSKCENGFKVCRLDEVDETVAKGIVGLSTDPNGDYALALLFFSNSKFPTSNEVARWLERSPNFQWDREKAVSSINQTEDGFTVGYLSPEVFENKSFVTSWSIGVSAVIAKINDPNTFDVAVEAGHKYSETTSKSLMSTTSQLMEGWRRGVV